MRFKWLAAFAALAFIGQAHAQDAATPALVYDLGGKFDKSFNEAAYNGAERFKAETGVEYREFEVQNESQREQALRNFARRGYSPIIAMSFSQEAPLTKVAGEFPDIKFAIVDAVVDLPNVRSIVFKEHEGSYLVGISPPWRRSPARSASSAAWTSRSSAASPAAMSRAPRRPTQTSRSFRT